MTTANATRNQTTNRALVRYLLLPVIFLTVALFGGVRVEAETRAFLFIPPPLITLFFAVLVVSLAARGRLVEFNRWLASEYPLLTNIAHLLTLGALFFATAQAFNSVLPESGLLRWLFSFFFLWTLWNNQFSSFDARRTVRSLAVLFGTAFFLKYMLLASLYAPDDGGFMRQLAGLLLQGVTLGTLGTEQFAPATGYISFFMLALYVVGLILLPAAPDDEETATDALPRRELSDSTQGKTPANLVNQARVAELQQAQGTPQLEAMTATEAADFVDAEEVSEVTIVREETEVTVVNSEETLVKPRTPQ